MSAAALLFDLSRLGIRLEACADRLRYWPRSALTPDLLARVKADKDKLLALLTSPTMAPETRRQIHGEMIERANARYGGGPIDWPALDTIENRFWSAPTLPDALSAAAEYETAVHAGHVVQ